MDKEKETKNKRKKSEIEYEVINNCKIEKETRRLVEVYNGYELPDTIEIIGEFAFE